MCDQKIIEASGKVFKVCIPYEIKKLSGIETKLYLYPDKIEVQGGYLTKFVLFDKIGYIFTSNGCAGTSDKLEFITKNGFNYSGCFEYIIENGNKKYFYPDKITVSGGYLRKVPDTSMRQGWNYYFEKTDTVKKSEDKVGKTNDTNSKQIISGLDNSTLLIFGIGLYFILS